MTMRSLFPLGRTLITPGAMEALGSDPIAASALIVRHVTGDWGDICAEDKRANAAAVKDGDRIMSTYVVSGARFYVITEADRAATTILLPSEY